jgi:hypothetical protein
MARNRTGHPTFLLISQTLTSALSGKPLAFDGIHKRFAGVKAKIPISQNSQYPEGQFNAASLLQRYCSQQKKKTNLFSPQRRNLTIVIRYRRTVLSVPFALQLNDWGSNTAPRDSRFNDSLEVCDNRYVDLIILNWTDTTTRFTCPRPIDVLRDACVHFCKSLFYRPPFLKYSHQHSRN